MKGTVIGTGYVGLVSGTFLAEVDSNAACLDHDEKKIQALTEGRLPIYEAGLLDMGRRNVDAGRFSATTNV